jgi:hypothetical protein
MNLAAILKARTLAFIDVNELNQRGRIRFSDLVPAIVERYSFQSFPTKWEDFDLSDKGVSFRSGRMGDVVIDELKIYSGLSYVESLSNTDDSRLVLIDLLEWGARDLGLTYTDGVIKHWAYISQISFTSEFPLLRSLSSPLDRIAHRTGKKVSEFFGEEISYYPMNFVAGHDPRVRKNGIAVFSVQQRAGVKFGENKFFSEAPLPTDVHLDFLREIESEAMGLKIESR